MDNINLSKNPQVASSSGISEAFSSNKVLKNTFILLSMTLLFSAAVAGMGVAFNWPHPGIILTLGGYFGLLYLTHKTKNSSMGIVSVFALTGFLGYTLGPIIGMYLTMFSNGGELVMMSLGGTGVIFLGLSGYAISSKKDFSFMGAFLFAGILIAFVASIAAFAFQIPALSLAVSVMFVLLMCGLILYQTSEIIHGGETNYILATVTLYVSIYNLFLSLLQLLGFFFGDD